MTNGSGADPGAQIDYRGFSDSLLSLRGIAALMVLVFHAATVFTIDGSQPPDRIQGLPTAETAAALARQWIFFVTNGHAAVSFFFVHSGFVLTLAFSRSRTDGLGLGYVGFIASYYVRRLFRLWPMIIVGCFALLVYQKLGVASSTDDLFSVSFRGAVAVADETAGFAPNVLLRRNDLNPFQWSIAYEVAGSILMPLFFLFGRMAFRPYCLLAIFYALILTLPLSQWSLNIDDNFVGAPRSEYIFCMVIGSLLFFACGTLRQAFPAKRRNVLVAGALSVLLLARWFIPDLRSAVLIEAVAASVILYAAYYFDAGPLQTICNFRVMRFYGAISYSFYINSILAIRIAGPLVAKVLGEEWAREHGLWATFACIIAAFAINTPLSWLTYRVVERPLMAIGRWISSAIARRYAAPDLAAQAVLANRPSSPERA